ncbi:Uncharacterised protein [Morganella morganii]|nr:Uncharacterised protein [Morganella morganii]
MASLSVQGVYSQRLFVLPAIRCDTERAENTASAMQRPVALFQFQLIHCRDTETAVNMQDFTGNTAGQIRAEERCRVTPHLLW